MIKREDLTKIGIYITIALVIINFVIRPLNSKIKQNKEMLSELKQAYLIKNELYEKNLYFTQTPQVTGEPKSLSLLYSKDIPYDLIRTKVLKWLIKKAEEKGLTIINFEIPEVKRGKEITEINVLLRLKGKIKPFLEYLKIVESHDKLILIKSVELYPSGQEFNINITFSFFRRET
uniref:Type II secretion system protein M n=1 Tax=Thermodesulfobacterium geofontis TaxID=1295609 RepID=A0A7V5XGG3_9BACT